MNNFNDLSKQSITLLYNDALNNFNFEKFKKIGDWIFFAKSMYPESIQAASTEYYNALAQISYYKCYRILRGQWFLYEELADRFPDLTRQARSNLIS